MPAPPSRQFKCELLTWAGTARDAKGLARIIRQSGFAPEIVVAIGRGGYVPARILCDYLHIKDLTSIKVEHWGIAATPDERAVVRFPLSGDIRGKRVLLVDDTTDTGDTMRVSLAYLRGFGPEEIRTAVLIHKAASEYVPDYYVKKVIKWRWVIFPWHVWEDLTAFVKKLKAEGIHEELDIQGELRARYSLDIQVETVREILSEID